MKYTISVLLILLNISAIAAGDITVTSPDKNIIFHFEVKNSVPQYSVFYKKQNLISNSSLTLLFDDGNAFDKVKQYKRSVITPGEDDYSLVIGKASHVHQYFSSATIYLKGNYLVNIEVRIFNDGVAFRYVFPQQERKNFTLLEEKTQFNLSGNPVVKALLRPNYTTSHEGLYTTAPLNEIVEDTLMDMPVLFQSKNVFIGISEAALLDYAGMYLTKHGGIITGILSPLPEQQLIKVKATFPHVSPWRVMLISDRVGALLESNIITSLNAPCAIKDTSWIQTGTTTFPWWNGTIIPDTTFAVGNNFETNQYYIDFCSANNVKYHTIVEANGHEWYTNDGTGYQPGLHVDVTKPVDGLDMKAICDYAHSKNVGVRVWVHWRALYPQLDSAFTIFEQWGLSGMMVDFLDRDDQEMVNIQTEILQKAAAHHLHIQFHGAYKPTGLARTYPNEFTREGTLNYENDKWNNNVTPDADMNIVFTRLLAGATDYHLGGFHAVSTQNFKVQFTRPLVMGTRCHMLAMYIVLENEQGMLCDYPAAYLGQPGFEVLQHMPTTWDETYVPAAKVDEYISIARRKGTSWYVGTMSNNKSRTVNIPFEFLPEGKYTATIYKDGPAILTDANDLKIEKMTIDKRSNINIDIAAGGGSVIILQKTKQ